MSDQSGPAKKDDVNEAKIERLCAILEVVANRFAFDSKEALAIRDAAMAYRDQPEWILSDQRSRAPVDGFHETKYGRVCTILESVANQFAPESDEAQAMRDAAMAYATIRHNQDLKIGYDHLCSLFEGGLTDEMKGRLQRRGIDTAELEVDDIGEWNLEK